MNKYNKVNTFLSLYKMYKLKHWVDTTRLPWGKIVLQTNTIPIIEQNLDKLDRECWRGLSKNPYAIHILEKNLDKVFWAELSSNPNAISILEKYPDKVHLPSLLKNKNAIHMIEKHIDMYMGKINNACISSITSNPFLDSVHIRILEHHIDKIDYMGWTRLSENPMAIPILEKYPNKIHITHLLNLSSIQNPSVITIIEKNIDKLTLCCWMRLSANPCAIPILEKNLDKINWFSLSRNPNAFHILEKYPEKIDWQSIDWDDLSTNHAIFELDYDSIRHRCSIYKEELIEIALHPSRIEKIIKSGIHVEELDNYI